MRTRRLMALSVVTATTVGLLVGPPLLSTATAVTPAPIAATPTAARNFGNGGPAVGAVTDAGPVAAAADGGILFWDSQAYEIRRIDPATGQVTAVAGTGTAAPLTARCTALNTTTPATSLPLYNVQGLWTDAAGDVFMWPGTSPCNQYGNVYRLDPSDHLWHLAVQNRGAGLGDYAMFGADGQGDIYVADMTNHVIRKYPRAADPTSAGVVVAGTVGALGSSGNGGPATAAKLQVPRALAVAADGSFVISSSGTIRRVDATTGLINIVAGTGTAPPTGQPSADDGMAATQARILATSLAISPDGQTVYFYGNTSGVGADRAFTLGGTVHTVVGPEGSNDSTGVPKSPGAQMVQDPTDPRRLIVSTAGDIMRWPVDGSAAVQNGTLIAGLPSTDGYAASADGTALSDAFVPDADAIAQAPDGRYAIATTKDIRGLGGLAATDTLSTLSHTGATGLAYDSDGTLYALRCAGQATNNCIVRKVVPGGTDVKVFGGGASPLSNGAQGTHVGLPFTTSSIAINQSSHTLYVVTGGSQVWSLALSSGIVHLVAGTGSSGNPVDTPDATNAPLSSVEDVAVDQTTGNLYLDASSGGVTVYEIFSNGSFKVLGGSMSDSNPHSLHVGADGTLYVDGSEVESFGTDGATSEQVPALGTVSTIRSDGSLVGFPADDGTAGGLLASTPPMPAPAYPGPLPTISATPGPASVQVTVTPPATSGETVSVRELPANSSVRYPNAGYPIATFTTDGTTTPRTFQVDNLGTNGSTPIGLVAGTTYRFDAIISDQNYGTSANPTFSSSAPQTATATPGGDTTAPAAPVISAKQNELSAQVTIIAPSDPDLASIDLREAVGSTPPSSPSSGQDVRTLQEGIDFRPGQTLTVQVPAAPTDVVSFSAFASDTSGNVSTAGTATKPAASQATGTAGGVIGWVARPGQLYVVWSGQVTNVRYAAGTTAPTTPSGGTPIGIDSSSWGPLAIIPVATGGKVAVSLFDYNDDYSSYTRTSFVLADGQKPSDALTMTATKTVAPGQSVEVSATLLRHGVNGVAPLANQTVDLYQLIAGQTDYTLVAGTTTDAAGNATFSVPNVTGNVTYQVRTDDIDELPLSATQATKVQQTVSLALSPSSISLGKSVTVSGAISSKTAMTAHLQRLDGTTWKTLKTFETTSTGTYTLTYKPSASGTFTLRTFVGATPSLLSAASTSQTLTVN